MRFVIPFDPIVLFASAARVSCPKNATSIFEDADHHLSQLNHMEANVFFFECRNMASNPVNFSVNS